MKKEAFKEIIYDYRAEALFDPLDDTTLAVEQRLCELHIENHRIQGLRPFKSRPKRFPPNSGIKKIAEVPLVLSVNGKNSIVIYDKVR